jgi:hypothetical protein
MNSLPTVGRIRGGSAQSDTRRKPYETVGVTGSAPATPPFAGEPLLNEQSTFLLRDDIAVVLRGLSALTGLSEWAEEDDEPVSEATVRRAKWLIGECAKECYLKSFAWRKPVVAATPSGEIHLLWRRGRATLSLNVAAGAEYVTCVWTNADRGQMVETLPAANVSEYVVRFLNPCFGR